jgi:predicted DsbA family dithiol-disulfide isomerase
MTGSSPGPLRIDIVSDVVCPWCAIGWRQLERALATAHAPAEIHWHPFELNPQLGPEGEELFPYLARKYGTTPERSRADRARITGLGAELGFTFAFDDHSRIRNTFRAHQLIHWAGLHGRAHAAKQALFAAHFTRGEDIHDLAVLAAVAGEVGLDRDEARAVIAEGRYAEAVRAEEALWTGRGVHAVPAIVFGGKYLVSGAQGVEGFADILRQLAPAG